jgi:hypothetical protein
VDSSIFDNATLEDVSFTLLVEQTIWRPALCLVRGSERMGSVPGKLKVCVCVCVCVCKSSEYGHYGGRRSRIDSVAVDCVRGAIELEGATQL